MSVSSVSLEETIEDTRSVPSIVSFQTLQSADLKDACIENTRVKYFFVTGTFLDDTYIAKANDGLITKPEHIFGTLTPKIIWCTANIERSVNEHTHFHALVELSTKTYTHSILRHMRKVGCTVNAVSESTFRYSFVNKNKPRGPTSLPWLRDISNLIWYCQKDKTRINHFEFGTFMDMSPTDAMKHIRKNILKGKPVKSSKSDSNTVDDALATLQPFLDNMRHYDTPQIVKQQLFDNGHSNIVLKHSSKIDEMVHSFLSLRFPTKPRINLGWFAWFGAPECGKTYGINTWSRQIVADHLGHDWSFDDIPLRSIVHRFNLKETKTSYSNEPILQCEEFFGDVLKLNDFKEINPIGSSDHTFSMPVKYKIEQARFNHIAMALTSNTWPVDWYHGVFSGPNGDIEYQAFMRRCGGLYFFPKYRVTNTNDPTSVVYKDGIPVVNKVELDGTTLLREAQYIDLTQSLSTPTWKEALVIKLSWLDQLHDMSASKKASILEELPPVDLTAQNPWAFRQAHTDKPIL